MKPFDARYWLCLSIACFLSSRILLPALGHPPGRWDFLGYACLGFAAVLWLFKVFRSKPSASADRSTSQTQPKRSGSAAESPGNSDDGSPQTADATIEAPTDGAQSTGDLKRRLVTMLIGFATFMAGCAALVVFLLLRLQHSPPGTPFDAVPRWALHVDAVLRVFAAAGLMAAGLLILFRYSLARRVVMMTLVVSMTRYAWAAGVVAPAVARAQDDVVPRLVGGVLGVLVPAGVILLLYLCLLRFLGSPATAQEFRRGLAPEAPDRRGYAFTVLVVASVCLVSFSIMCLPGLYRAVTEKHLRQAVAAHKAGDTEEALRLYAEVLRRDRSAVEAHCGRAEILAMHGRNHEAMGHYRRGLMTAPDNVRAHVGVAAILAKTDEPEEAVRHCRRALEHDPENNDVLCSIGDILLKCGKASESVRVFRRVLAEEPEHTKALAGLGTEVRSRRVYVVFWCPLKYRIVRSRPHQTAIRAESGRNGRLCRLSEGIDCPASDPLEPPGFDRGVRPNRQLSSSSRSATAARHRGIIHATPAPRGLVLHFRRWNRWPCQFRTRSKGLCHGRMN